MDYNVIYVYIMCSDNEDSGEFVYYGFSFSIAFKSNIIRFLNKKKESVYIRRAKVFFTS